MEQIQAYLFMFGIIIVIGQVFRHSSIPISLILVVTGIVTSILPFSPRFNLNPNLTLNVFLPLLIYQSSAFTSWRDIRKNFRSIAVLSVGHVIFITILVAVSIHALIPHLGWPLSFVLGAVISPPDDVAILSIGENIRLPERVFTILEGEAMFNDAAALILFRFALVALVTHEFSVIQATSMFFMVIIGEVVYGFLLGNLIGKMRQRIANPAIHVMASLLTPFLAYIPMVEIGGCGVIATAITGFIIGNQYSIRFTPEFRLISQALWPALGFAIQGILFLMVGFNIREIFEGIAVMRFTTLGGYAFVVITVVIVGRFVWEFSIVSVLPRVLSIFFRRKNPIPPWQALFLISWAGMRGSISLAAVLSVPLLPAMIDGVNPRDLVIFLVCCVIIATLILQGLSLPWLIKVMGLEKHGQREEYHEHLAELSAKINMTRSALRWLLEYKKQVSNDQDALDEVKIYIREYKMSLRKLKVAMAEHDLETLKHSEDEEYNQRRCILSQIVEVQRAELLKLWRLDKVNLVTRNKLMAQLDHQIQNLITE